MSDDSNKRGRLERAVSFTKGLFDVGKGIKEIHHALSRDKKADKD